MDLLLILGIASLATAAYFVAEAATLPARQRTLSVRRAATYGKLRLSKGGENEQFRERVLTPMKNKLAGWVLRLNPRTTMEAVSAKLLAAGMNRTLTPTGYLATKAALAVSGVVVGSLFGGVAAGFGGTLLCALAFGGALFVVPDVLVTFKARARREAVRAELPDALDLLAVSVEAGLGFDAAIAKLTERMDGSLADEFALTLNQMRIGESRQDALKNMSERVPAPELASFVRALIQADQLGISLGRILRVQAADSRNRRQSAAEETAMKAPIKMLFPTVIFIFPAMFLVVLGPAFLNLSKLF